MTRAPQDVDVSVLRVVPGIPEVCSLTTNAIDENKDVRDDLKDRTLNVQDVDALRSLDNDCVLMS